MSSIMSKRIKSVLIAFLTASVTIIALAAAFIYFSVEDRIAIDGSPGPFDNNNPITRLDSTVLSPDSVTAFINSIVQKAHVHGLGVSIISNHRLVYQKYFGMSAVSRGESFKPGTIFYSASLSKPIFADIVLQLAEDGVLHLDTPLYRYLRKPIHTYRTNFLQRLLGANPIDYSDLANDDRLSKITPRMCLSHTTGLPNWRRFEEDGKLKFLHAPGARYNYSGEGMFLLQIVLEEMTGRDFEDIAVEKIFSPSGMTRSSYVWQREYEGNYARGHDANGGDLRIPKANNANAAYSLSTTLEDFTRYFALVLSQKEDRHRQLIEKQVLIKSRQQFGPESRIDTDENDAIQLGYGLGFGLYETPFGTAFFKEGHGDGWQHYAVGFPDQGTALIMMSNSDNAESTFKQMIEFCLANPYTPWYWEGYIPFEDPTNGRRP